MKSTLQFNKKYLSKLPLSFLILLSVFSGALLGFIYLVHEVMWEKEDAFDVAFLNFLSKSITNSHLTVFMKSATFMASSAFLIFAYSVLILGYLINKHWKRAAEIALAGLGGFAINYVMKLYFHRARPLHPLMDPLKTFSFPSGHSTSAVIFYGLLAYLLWKADIPKSYRYMLTGFLFLFAILIGFSRIYLRMHYPSDVVAGFFIGFAWLALSVWLFEKLKKKSDKELKTSKYITI